MATLFQFELVSPEKLLVSQKINEVVLPGSEGYLTVLSDHAPMVTRLASGVVRLKDEAKNEHAFVVFGGFADISVQGCSVLAEQAIPVGEFNSQMLEERITKLQESMQKNDSDVNHNHSEDLLYELINMRDSLL